jgi:hypothetical protein
MSNPDRGHHILAFALVAAVIGLLGAYSFARADETAMPPPVLPFHTAVGLSVKGPGGADIPIYFGVFKQGFATQAECEGPKGVDSPEFHALVKRLSEAVSVKIGTDVTAVAGCVDITKLPPPDAAPSAPAQNGKS